MLLVKDPAKRLGSGPDGLSNLKKHPFFAGLNWSKIYKKEVKPEFVPCEKSQSEFRYFQVQNCTGAGNEDGEGIDLLGEDSNYVPNGNGEHFELVEGFSFF